ncbi:hypothetical protein BJ992_005328 [Sphaerisporangium rubeum]|uniref:Uncharacterized protein n=1 Tax=Sphaerisporangium rubeum TaxID=321317 RepID=A0A7X0IIM1_9ACTN|nr:hypothetical protein [Sphaerisporangium rubeum]
MMSSAAFMVTQGKADRRDREPFRAPVPSAPDPRVGPARDGIRGEAVPRLGPGSFHSPTPPAARTTPTHPGTSTRRPTRSFRLSRPPYSGTESSAPPPAVTGAGKGGPSTQVVVNPPNGRPLHPITSAVEPQHHDPGTAPERRTHGHSATTHPATSVTSDAVRPSGSLGRPPYDGAGFTTPLPAVPAPEKRARRRTVRPTRPTLHGTTRHGTTRHGTARHHTARHHTARHHTARHHTARHHTARHHTARHHTARHHTARHHTARHHTARHHTARHHTARHHTARHHTARHHTARHDTARSARSLAKGQDTVAGVGRFVGGQVFSRYSALESPRRRSISALRSG